jgi:hypothetical protein
MSGVEPMDVQRALQLWHTGLTWNEIGKRLAQESNRRVPYLGTSVARAVSTFGGMPS